MSSVRRAVPSEVVSPEVGVGSYNVKVTALLAAGAGLLTPVSMLTVSQV